MPPNFFGPNQKRINLLDKYSCFQSIFCKMNSISKIFLNVLCYQTFLVNTTFWSKRPFYLFFFRKMKIFHSWILTVLQYYHIRYCRHKDCQLGKWDGMSFKICVKHKSVFCQDPDRHIRRGVDFSFAKDKYNNDKDNNKTTLD